MIMPLLISVIVLCVLSTTASWGSGVCPESKRRYPGDCRLFYRCVPLPMPAATASLSNAGNSEVAHAHVWVPTRCTAGLVFEQNLKKCILPDDNWDCNNDDQLIPVVEQDLPPQIQSEDTTEEMHIAVDKGEEYNNMMIPNIVDIVSHADLNDGNANLMDIIDRTTSTTLDRTPSRYHAAMTRRPYVPVMSVNNQSVDQIATQMDRIADMAHNLKAVAHTVAPPRQTAWNRLDAPSAPVTMTHDYQIPAPAGLNQLMNPSTMHFVTKPPNRVKAHFVTEPSYGVNLIQLNKITAQLMQAKQSPISVNTQQHLTNINLFGSGSGVLKHVEQTTQRAQPNSMDRHNAAHVVSTLFNKYLANKSFTVQNATHKPPVYSMAQINEMMVSASRREPVPLRLQFGYKKAKPTTTTTTTTEAPLPCISGVRLANATDCRRYYMCNASNSLIHSYSCPPYTAFNKVRRMCDVAQYAYCSNPTYAEDNIVGDQVDNRLHLIRQQEQLPIDACAIRDKLPDPTSTRRYIICLKTHNGKWIRHQMTCPGSLTYCPHRNLCTPTSNCYYY